MGVEDNFPPPPSGGKPPPGAGRPPFRDASGNSAEIERLFQTAMAHFQNGKMRKAEKGFEGILRTEPDHFASLNYLGIIRAQQNKHEEAIGLLSKAAAQNTASPAAHVNLAVLFETLNRPDDAIAQCQAALAIKSDCADAYFTAANAYTTLKRYDEATQHFLKAIAIEPNFVEAYYNLGNVCVAVKLPELAIDAYSQAISIKPHYPKALNNRAVLLYELKRYREALKDLDQALTIQPRYFEALINRGNTLLELGWFQTAIESFDRALSALPADVSTDAGRGMSFSDGRQFHDAQSLRISNIGAAIAHYGKAMGYRAADLERSTKLIEQSLTLLVEAGALPPPPKSPELPRYPVSFYPDALRAVVDRLNGAGIEAFLCGGTLLGAMRDNQFLSFDKDIDFGIDESVTLQDLRRVFADDPDFQLSGEYADDAVLVSFYWRDKIAIDFFRFFKAADHVWCGLDLKCHMLKWIHDRFDLVDFDWQGVTTRIPANSDHFLTEVYGDWRTPRPYFGLFASPNIEGGFSPICRNLAYSAIVQAIFKTETAKAIDLCRQVLEFDSEDSFIDKLYHLLTADGPRMEVILPSGVGKPFEDSPG